MKEGLTTSEQVKKYLNKKMILGASALFFSIAIIFVCSIVPLAIDPKQWNDPTFISDEMIIVALTVLGEVCLLMIGQSYNEAQPVSKIAKARVEFDKSIEINIGNRPVAHDQWVREVLEKQDQKDKYRRLLRNAGLENIHYFELTRAELKQLLKQPLSRGSGGDKIYFRQLTKKQYKLIIEILDGKHVIDFVSPDTYRKLSKIDTDKTTSEKLANQQKKKTYTVLNSVFTKTLIVLASGLIFGALIPTGNEQELGETFLKLFTRLFSFTSAGFVGFMLGGQINDIDAEYIREKIDVHKRFASDKEFKPKTEQELAKQEFAEYVKEQNKLEMERIDLNNKIEFKGESYGR